MTKAELNKKPKKTLILMATLKRVYAGGKKTAEKKTKPQLVNALYKAYGKKKVSGNQHVNTIKRNKTKETSWKGSNQHVRKGWIGKRKFGIDIETAKDITEINKKIRRDIDKFKTLSPIEKSVRESQYLYTLSFTPAWRKDMRGKLQSIRKRAKSEYCKTVTAANKRRKKLNLHHITFSKLCKR